MSTPLPAGGPPPDPIATAPPGPPGPPAGAAPAILARGLHRSFGTVRAVAGVDLAVRRGSVTALVGPNGSGKTTLLLILAGLLAPDHGSVLVAGADPASSALARSRIGWMPDSFGTWDSLTAVEVLTTMAGAYRLGREEGSARAWDLLRAVHLDDLATAPAHTLSRGQKQRLGMARALINSPDVLLLDEPASGLDPRSRIEMRALLRGLAAGGTTVLISSHVLAELDEMVDDAVFLTRGRTISAEQLGTGAGTRRWRLRSLDPAALQRWAAQAGVPLVADTDTPDVEGSVLVDVADDAAAAALLAAAVGAGVPVVSLAPVSGLLEQAYLTLDTDRR
ncbi:ABC transporter ATP-binding protein [Occultella gossypii]|uniref:ABC transporter ATP-binding protein n=1 Tax=Occultella gossypii TaxID=2800820 RepID=A0ABS7SAI3_9MICO|nr:ABC transporter ATP-binding protein [Occultella gossypii]MBZ2197361.1 ABC transporter ATP-binding protein [Occultella gossypii]